MQVTKSSLHQGKLVVKLPLEDQDVWGNKFVTRQGKVVMERSCLVTMHERNVLVHDFWGELEEWGLLKDCDTPSSLQSLVSDISEDALPFSSKGRVWEGVCYSRGRADFMSVIPFLDILSIICGCDMEAVEM